jgi:hypothetical protein
VRLIAERSTDMAHTLLLAVIVAQGVSGLVGGFALLADPSGDALGLPLSWLDGTPFVDYWMPGLILLSALGLFPLLVAWGLWKRRPQAWLGSLIVGGSLTVWIAVEILLIGYKSRPPLQHIYGLLGLIIIGLTLSRPVRRRLRDPRGADPLVPEVGIE